jgi:hypothetical protein
MQGIKEAILSAHQQRKDLKIDLLKIQAALRTSKLKLFASYALIYGLVNKNISENIKNDIRLQKDAIQQVKEQIENSYVGLEVEFDEEIRSKYESVISAFKKLITCEKIWDVTSAHQQDRAATRSSAGTIVNKREVRFGFKSIPDIKTQFEPLWFNNANGADLYFYPNFIIMHSSKTEFAVIGLEELEFSQSFVRFVETGSVPSDTKIIDKTWAKVNKDGTPDKRFKGNYQIPIVKYGEIRLKTRTGLNEEYEFSNYEFTEEFGQAFRNYLTTIKNLKKLNE